MLFVGSRQHCSQHRIISSFHVGDVIFSLRNHAQRDDDHLTFMEYALR